MKTLAEIRAERGLTQAEIGSRALVSSIELGHRLPGPRALKRMADVLGLSPLRVMEACRESARQSDLAAANPSRRVRSGRAHTKNRTNSVRA